MRHDTNRRTFLKTSAALAAGSLAVDSALANFATPNEQPVVAVIGTGIRFGPLARATARFVPCAAVCDIDTRQSSRAVELMASEHAKYDRKGKIDVVHDYRRILDRDDIDAVIIATPDHWHTKIACEAMRAGKDIYCEKPLTLTVREGNQILQVLNETGRVFQVGTQQRSDFGQRFLQAVAVVRDGRIGNSKTITCAIGGTPDCPELAVGTPPKELDWETWQGQAPIHDFLVGDIIHTTGWGAGYPLGRTHRYFRWFYEYSGGKLTDWGAHHVDIALWAIDKLRPNTGNFTVDPLMVEHPVPFVDGNPTVTNRFNTATKFNVKVTYEDGVELFIRDKADDLGFENGIMFQGDKGRFFVNRGKITGRPIEDLASNPLAADAVAQIYGDAPIENDGGDPIAHMNNWLSSIKTRKTPISDVESHHRMLCVCHCANIAMRLGRKITFNPADDSIVGDEQATAMLARTQRKGYEIDVRTA